jgi:hypothetical protein
LGEDVPQLEQELLVTIRQGTINHHID